MVYFQPGGFLGARQPSDSAVLKNGHVCAALCFVISGAIVLIGAWFGDCMVKPANPPVGFMASLCRIDGQNYGHIVESGYSYAERSPSYVAFFPAYPLVSRWIARLTRLPTTAAEIAVSNACWLATLLIAGCYLGRVNPRGDAGALSLLAMGMIPTVFFFRMAYSQSMFLAIAVVSLYGMARAWPPLVLALVVGLETAVRPVGVALLVPFSWYLWKCPGSRGVIMARIAYILPLACWGLIAYMIFQYVRFDQPLAFAITQKYHRMRPIGNFGEEVLALLSWEPIRDTYSPTSTGYWRALYSMPSRWFSLEFANPIYLIGTAALIALGAWKRWLTSYELLLAVPLIVMPYFLRAYEMRMLSQARFMVVVFPAYIVMGNLLARIPPVVAGSLLALSGFMMGIYAALFAAGYPFL